jgi:hypothetical protein
MLTTHTYPDRTFLNIRRYGIAQKIGFLRYSPFWWVKPFKRWAASIYELLRRRVLGNWVSAKKRSRKRRGDKRSRRCTQTKTQRSVVGILAPMPADHNSRASCSTNDCLQRFVGRYSVKKKLLGYSAMLTPEPPISSGTSFSFGKPSFIRSTVS